MRANLRFIICLIALFGAAALALLLPQARSAVFDSITLESQSVGGAVVSLITVDLNDPTLKISIGLPERGLSHAESFGSFVRRHQPLAAVTGTYFDMRSLLPVGSIVIDGRMVHQSHIGSAVCFTNDNKVRIVEAQRGQSCDLSGAQCALRAGPRLLANGEYALDPRREGFRHPGLFGRRTRMVLGVTPMNKLLLAFVRTPVTFARTAGIMRSLGATDAICLDGGTSSAMYFRGRIVRHPGRTLTNIIEVVRRPMPYISIATTVLQRPTEQPTEGTALRAQSTTVAFGLGSNYEHAAVLGYPIRLRPAKGLHSLFPVDRTKLAGLKRPDDS